MGESYKTIKRTENFTRWFYNIVFLHVTMWLCYIQKIILDLILGTKGKFSKKIM